MSEKDKKVKFEEPDTDATDVKLGEAPDLDKQGRPPGMRGGRPKGSGHPISDDAKKERAETSKKPKYEKSKYKDHPAAKTARLIVTNLVNKLVLTHCEKLKPEDTEELSASLAYCLDYYLPAGGLDPNSPLVVIAFASLGFGLKVVELRGIPEKPKEATPL